MVKNMIYNSLFITIVAFGLSAQELSHGISGTYYEKESPLAYATHRHGPDGALFLDPYFIPYLLNLEGQQVLDAGCGTGPWAIYAAENGAEVFALDLQEKMIELAKEAVKAAGANDKVTLALGDVADLPCTSDFFDRSLSINVGCNLPSTTKVYEKMKGLGPHIKEMARVLKDGGIAVVTAPASFGTVFTDGTAQEKVYEHISKVLGKITLNPSSGEIIDQLNELKEVYRATFAKKNGKLALITDEKQMVPGEEIWRKLPGLTVPNRYHPESEYLQEFADAGLKVKECFRPQFSNHLERLKYNASMPNAKQLGEEYIEHYPFVIFCLIK